MMQPGRTVLYMSLATFTAKNFQSESTVAASGTTWANLTIRLYAATPTTVSSDIFFTCPTNGVKEHEYAGCPAQLAESRKISMAAQRALGSDHWTEAGWRFGHL